MKKYIYAAAMAILASCASKTDGFILRGELANADQGSVVIYDQANKIVDTAKMEGGKFVAEGKIEIPQIVHMFIADEKDSNLVFTGFFLENSCMEFTADTKDESRTRSFKGGALNDEYNEYAAYIETLEETKIARKLRIESSRAYSAGEKERSKAIMDSIVPYQLRIMDRIMAYKPDSKTSPVAAAHISDIAMSMELKDLEYAASLFAADYTGSFYLNEMRDEIGRQKKVAIGSQAADFKLKDLSGKEYTLADFKGKYVYMEFSSSWCGWCKKEIPFIREAYHALKDENIVFVTMNMDDDRAKWEGDVKKENIEWLSLSNCEGMQSDFAKSYNIHGIPAIFILDPDGKILMKDVRQNDLLPTLKELLGK